MTQENDDVIDFRSDRKFYDDEYFPYGFDRSGEFTLSQAQLLTDNGRAYRALALGERLPVTELEQEFVLYCQGGKTAETIHERVWKRYSENCSRSSVYHSVALNRPSEYGDEFPIDTD